MKKVREAWKRRQLIKSAQRKVAKNMSCKGITSDEWNALAYKPLQEARKATAPKGQKDRTMPAWQFAILWPLFMYELVWVTNTILAFFD